MQRSSVMLKRTLGSCLAVVALLSLLCGQQYKALGFSLNGPHPAWQTPRIGYAIGLDWFPGYGPMNIGEEYRWNIPTLYYGFSPAFLNYFGQRGVVEVDKAVAVLNAIPSVAQLSINDYPNSSLRVNIRASASSLLDLKSFALSMLLNNLGPSDSTRWVWTLRNRYTTPNTTNFFTIRRNFDPDTWQPSSFVNGELWTYTVQETYFQPTTVGGGAFILDVSSTFTYPVDPVAGAGFQNAPVASRFGTTLGGYWTSLTRDDVAALQYIYRKNNYHVEHVAPLLTTGSGGGGPYDYPGGVIITNLTGGTNLGTGIVIDTSLRPGIEKINFQKVYSDSLLGSFLTTNVIYKDTYITNSTLRTQTITRALFQPDFVFDAGDLVGSDSSGVSPSATIGTTAWLNNSAINNLGGFVGNNFGPGNITPGSIYTLNTVGQIYLNTYPISPLDEANANLGFIWGSFDGSTNEPVIYPYGASIKELEAKVLNR